MTESNRPLTAAQNVEIYRDLVNELTSDSTDEKKVKKLMNQLGLKYSTERIKRLSQLLTYSPSSQNKGTARDL